MTESNSRPGNAMPSEAEAPSASPRVDPSMFALWSKYEDVAIHFNDLIMRWRLQAMGGAAAIVTVAGFVVADAPTPHVRYRAMIILAHTFTAAWIGVAVIDLFYYRKLLLGAVEEILEVEKRNPDIQLSTRIEIHGKRGATITPWIFYLMGLLPLALIAWYGYRSYGALGPELTANPSPLTPP